MKLVCLYNTQSMAASVIRCRICRNGKIKPFLNLGPMPLPNGFLRHRQLKYREPYYPLSVGVCQNCWLVQLTDVVKPEIMFRNYVYIPSASQTRLENFQQIVSQALDLLPPFPETLAIDIGSNDGSLLLEFKKRGIRTLGIDPAENLAKVAQLKGIETINNLFSLKNIWTLHDTLKFKFWLIRMAILFI